MNSIRRRARVTVTGGGKRLVNHAGTRLLADLADVIGLTEALSAAMAPTKKRCRGHDRGEVLVDLAVMIADGGEAISDLGVLRDQPELFGEVASNPTAWRTLQAIDDAVLARIKTARARARAAAWAAGGDPGFYVIDIDATLVGSHSDKQQAAPTYKRGFGFIPSTPISTPPAKPSPVCCVPATPGRAPPPITSPCSTTRWRNCPSTPPRAR